MSNSHNRKHIEKQRRNLRKSLTRSEAKLWKHLQDKQLKGRIFRRQHSIKDYIVDFYCAAEKLIIELDGDSVHLNHTQQDYEEERIHNIEKIGPTIVHIEDILVLESIDEVLEKISSFFKKE